MEYQVSTHGHLTTHKSFFAWITLY